MIFFILSISYLFNPYLLLLVNSTLNIKTPKIYFCLTFLLYFLFFNTRIYDDFILRNKVIGGDDSGDYIRAAKIISNYSILDILSAKADGILSHIDKAFALLQLFLSYLVPPNSTPYILSLIFAVLLLSSLITYPKITRNFINFSPRYLGSIIILNPYIIFINQHLFRQGIALALMVSLAVPYILKVFIKEQFIKLNNWDIIFLFLSLFIPFGFHRGSIIGAIGLIIISYFFSQNLINNLIKLITNLVLNKRTLIFLIGLLLFAFIFSLANKYYIFLIDYFIKLKLRGDTYGDMNIRTGLFGLIFSFYGIYAWKTYKLKNIYKSNLRKFNISFSLLNSFISLLVLLTNVAIPRILFTTNVILLAFTLLSYKVNNLYLKIVTFLVGLITFNNYIFVKVGFWGKGDFLFPYFN